MKTIFSLSIALFLFSILPAQTTVKTPETLLGFSLNDEQKLVSITVVTNGCTAKADFNFQVKKNTVTVYRNKKDVCKRMSEAVTFTYTFTETGIDPNKKYTLLNPFTANVFTANIR